MPGAVQVIGTPMVFGLGFIALVLLLLPVTHTWAESIVTVAHEMGHVVVAVVTGRGTTGFEVHETTGGGVTPFRGGWGVTLPLVFLAGYPMPPLLGLGGATLVSDGRPVAVLWIATALLLTSFMHARGVFTNVVVLLFGAGIVWAAVDGTTEVQSGVAVGLVWLMLLGGVTSLRGQALGREGSDAAQLQSCTWVPKQIWALGFLALAVYCLYRGAVTLAVV